MVALRINGGGSNFLSGVLQNTDLSRVEVGLHMNVGKRSPRAKSATSIDLFGQFFKLDLSSWNEEKISAFQYLVLLVDLTDMRCKSIRSPRVASRLTEVGGFLSNKTSSAKVTTLSSA